MFVFIKSEPRLWTAGFYDPAGKWHAVKDFGDQESAEKYVSKLNGERA